MHGAVLVPDIVWEVFYDSGDGVLCRRYKINHICLFIGLPINLQLLGVVNPRNGNELPELAAGGEHFQGGVVEDQNYIVPAKLALPPHIVDHVIKHPPLGVGPQRRHLGILELLFGLAPLHFIFGVLLVCYWLFYCFVKNY